MTNDHAAAATYVAALAGSADAEMTWQLLRDDKRGRPFAQEYHLSLDRIWRELAYQNGRGVGVFAMVNAGDGGGRKAANVTRLRALFVDDDEGRLSPGSPDLAPLPPSFAVRSKRGSHFYWLLEPGEPLDAFTPAQVALASHFGTDAAVKDLPRVMRVPGFFHMKDPADPFMVMLIAGSGRRHTVAEVLAAFPARHLPAKVVPVAPSPPGAPAGGPRRIAESGREAAAVLAAFSGLRLIRWAVESPEDVSREAWRGIATNLAAAVLDHEELHDQAAELFREISEPDTGRYSAVACDRTFRDALKSARDFGPMTFATLESAGVPPEICAAGREHAKAPVGVARLLARADGRRRVATR
jgi:hypothetical protein